MEVIQINEKYLIIYDDKGYKPVKKIGTITSKEKNLIEINCSGNKEILNINNIIRAEKIE